MVHIVVSPATMRKWISGFAALFVVVAGSAMFLRAQSAAAPATGVPGALSDGTILLANGWRVSPSGRTIKVGTLPLNLAVSPDGRYAVVTNNGLSRPSFSVIDIASWTVKSTTPIDAAWLGLVFSPDGTRLYSAGAAQNNVQEFTFADGIITRARTFALPASSGDSFAAGLTISRDGRTLFVTRVFAMTLSAIDVASGAVTRTAQLSSEPYTAAMSPDGRYVYVSLWGGAAVDIYTADSLMLMTELPTGKHPNALTLSPDGRRLFVACGSSASVWVFDTFSFEAIEQVSMSLYPEAPITSTPNALAMSPDGRTLLVANADNNSVAIVDVSNPARSFVNGFVPTGWYPTAVAFTPDARQLIVLSGKGMTPAPNPQTGGMETRLLGLASIVPVPDCTTLADYTRRVQSLTPYADSLRLNPAGVPVGSPIPRTVGGASPVKHVFYVIRENRTYDQVLGDLSEGNGDPRLTLFGRDVTPNAHALAQQFVVFDNFYTDADVSYNGHSYSTAAYATDFVEKMWQTNFMGRGGPYLAEGGGLLRNPFGNITAPSQGYIWDYARRAGVTFRSYGEFVVHTSRSATGDVVAAEAVPGLHGAVAPSYAGWDLDITDARRADNWIAEFHQFEANGNLPQLSIIRLPNDHTAGTRVGSPTPRAMVADNDLALGRIVETISTSVYWRDSAVFVLEDDAQSGPDHVDSHRSILLAAGPFVKRGFVDHTFYTTSGVLRTIELILGLPPMSQYDAAATSMYNAFTGTPNTATFRHVEALVSLTDRNTPASFGSVQSMAMDFSAEDRAPEAQLNEILWRSIRGPHAAMPPPRRSAFVSPSSRDVDADEQ